MFPRNDDANTSVRPCDKNILLHVKETELSSDIASTRDYSPEIGKETKTTGTLFKMVFPFTLAGVNSSELPLDIIIGPL